jgi:predicted nuclease of predicted toxin-antitoxin system
MKLYLDEDIASHHLGQALRKAGHDVVPPGEIGRLGRSDTLQIIYAVEADRILVTGNHRDFEDLHDLIVLCGGSHPGVFAICKDNNSRRDMKAVQIVTAIANIASVVASMRNLFIRLNDWR